MSNSNKYDKVSTTDDVDDEHPTDATENTQLNNDRDGENATTLTHLPRKNRSKWRMGLIITLIAIVVIIILAVILTTQYQLPPDEKPIDPEPTSLAITNNKKKQS